MKVLVGTIQTRTMGVVRVGRANCEPKSLNDLRVDTDGDRFRDSVIICDFLEEIVNSDGFEKNGRHRRQHANR